MVKTFCDALGLEVLALFLSGAGAAVLESAIAVGRLFRSCCFGCVGVYGLELRRR